MQKVTVQEFQNLNFHLVGLQKVTVQEFQNLNFHLVGLQKVTVQEFRLAESDSTGISEFELPGTCSRPTLSYDFDSDATRLPESELDISSGSQFDDFSIPGKPFLLPPLELHAKSDCTGISEFEPQYSRSTSLSDSDSDATRIPENSPRSQSDDFSCWIPETPPPPPVVQLHAEIDCTKIVEIDSRSTSPSDSDSDATGIPETELDNSPRSQSDDFSCWIPETPPPPSVVQLHAEIDCTKIVEIDSRSTSPSDSDSDATGIPETELDNSPRSQSSDLSCWIPETDLSDIEDPNKEGRHSFFDLKVC